MSEIVLVHGAAHGAWCWRDVIPALAKLGHNVTALDLPGHGTNPSPIPAITLDAYRDAILSAISTRAVVVGHSMAGYPITAAAEKTPHRIEKLIYLCAHVPAPGKSLSDMRKLVPEQPLLPAIQMAEDGASFTFDPALAESCFFHDCPPGTLDYALPRLVPQAVAPNSVPVETSENYARIPRHYIRCAHDNAVPLSLQTLVSRDFSPQNIHTMQTGHSPFFADPVGLAQLIHQITES